jgi:hypothetical protein
VPLQAMSGPHSVNWCCLPQEAETLALIVTSIRTAIGSAFSSVVIAVTYYELRAAKEGIDIQQIASVFD